MSVRKRTWKTREGDIREAWVVDYSDQLGNRHLKTFTRKKDADAYHAQVAVDVGAGIHTADSRSITVTEAGRLWIESGEAAGLERTTLEGYQRNLDLHITPLIGLTKLSAITVPFVRAFEDKLREDLSPAMVRKVLVGPSSILSDAQERPRWDLAAALLVTGVFGWTAGVIPAIIDAIIVVNRVMHNTLGVPGHFHFYLLLGEMAMAFGFMAWLTRAKTPEGLFGAGYWGFLAYLIGGTGVAVMFLIGGAMSVPRRWAVHLPQWFMQDRVSAVFALISIIGALVLLGRYLTRFALTARA